MKGIWSVIFFILYMALAPIAYSFSVETVNNEKTIPFTIDMLPILSNFTSVNSSSIGGFWQPPPSIENINITELEGSLSAGVSSYSRRSIQSGCIIKRVDKLNETDEYIFDKLEPDTVYQVCFQSQWHAPNTTVICLQPNGLYHRNCQLLRTYTEDGKTLNPVPVFGEYTWTQIMTSATTLGIIVNASVSSELPYTKLNITVTLGSEMQSQLLNMSLEWADFMFDGFVLEPKDYPLSITFTSIDTEKEDLRAATNTLNGTIRTIIPTSTSTSTSTPTPEPTSTPSMGNKSLACHFLFFVFLTIFVPLLSNESI